MKFSRASSMRMRACHRTKSPGVSHLTEDILHLFFIVFERETVNFNNKHLLFKFQFQLYHKIVKIILV